jgi:type III pantothenate kinase
MKPDVVVDVGNSRIKWGLCGEDRVAELVSLPPDDTKRWDHEHAERNLSSSTHWAISGVNPTGLAKVADWIKEHRANLTLLSSFRDLPISVSVDLPEKVGIDRLLNAVAARHRVKRNISLFIIDAGTAVTVDWVDPSGAFRGGAILPGLRLMARSLHEHTALLPKLDVSQLSDPVLPGASTESAMKAGIFWAVAGGIKAVLGQLTACADAHQHRAVFLTGGDAHLLEPVMDSGSIVWPQMTLEGIRLSAETLP